jgi:hypothetical protein
MFIKRDGVSIPARQWADSIERHAKALGYNVTRDASNLSTSQYLHCYTWQDAEKTEYALDLRIRVASHEQRPSYYQEQDFEVGKVMSSNGDWRDCVKWLAEKIGKPVPASLLALEKREAEKRENRKAEYVEREEKHRQERAQAEAELEKRIAENPQGFAAHMALRPKGRDRKFWRAAFGKERCTDGEWLYRYIGERGGKKKYNEHAANCPLCKTEK